MLCCLSTLHFFGTNIIVNALDKGLDRQLPDLDTAPTGSSTNNHGTSENLDAPNSVRVVSRKIVFCYRFWVYNVARSFHSRQDLCNCENSQTTEVIFWYA